MAVARGSAGVESIAAALSPANARISPPMAPGTGLLMVRAGGGSSVQRPWEQALGTGLLMARVRSLPVMSCMHWHWALTLSQ